MANRHKLPLRGIRGIEPDDWDDFANATQQADTDRSGAVREFIRWYLRRPGAKLPKRP